MSAARPTIDKWLGKAGARRPSSAPQPRQKRSRRREAFKAQIAAQLQAPQLPAGRTVRLWALDEMRAGWHRFTRRVWVRKGVCVRLAPASSAPRGVAFTVRWERGWRAASSGLRRRSIRNLWQPTMSRLAAATPRAPCVHSGRGRVPFARRPCPAAGQRAGAAAAGLQPRTQPGGEALGSAQGWALQPGL